jgi:hypothetical protein
MQANLQILIAPSACPAKLERIVWLLAKTVRIAMLANTVKGKKKMVTSLIQRLVLVVQLVSFLWKKEVRNVSRVVRVRLAMGVKIVPKGMREKEPTVMLPNANNVH